MEPKRFIGLGKNDVESYAIQETMKKEHEQIQSIAAEIKSRGFQLKEQVGDSDQDITIEEVVQSYLASGGKHLFEKYSQQKAKELFIDAMLEGGWLEIGNAVSEPESDAA